MRRVPYPEAPGELGRKLSHFVRPPAGSCPASPLVACLSSARESGRHHKRPIGIGMRSEDVLGPVVIEQRGRRGI
jgi:hypothetical protein